MNTRRVALGVRLPAVDRGDEAAEGHHPRRRGAVRAEAERVAHDRAHAEPAEHRVLRLGAGALPGLVVEAGELLVRRVERVVVREPDARHDVPVLARPAGHLQRAARRDDVQPPLAGPARPRGRAGRARRPRGRGGGSAALRRAPAAGRSRRWAARSWPGPTAMCSGRPSIVTGSRRGAVVGDARSRASRGPRSGSCSRAASSSSSSPPRTSAIRSSTCRPAVLRAFWIAWTISRARPSRRSSSSSSSSSATACEPSRSSW